MPERIRTVTLLTEDSVGGPIVWNFGRVKVGQKRTIEGHEVVLTDEIWDQQYDKADRLYSRVVETINWNRILIEASIIHLNRQEKDPEHEDNPVASETCGHCLEAALLAEDRIR